MNHAGSNPAVVALIGDRHRIIVSSCGLQWIIEKRAGQRHGIERWDSVKYCRTRKGLIASCRALGVEIAASEMSKLEALPERFGGDS